MSTLHLYSNDSYYYIGEIVVKSLRSIFVSLSAVLLILAGCGNDEASVADNSLADSSLTVVVTTNILGDVVERLVGDEPGRHRRLQ